jgi:hypothetical protein
MPQKELGRREFLKLAIAAAGAAGLSHFRVLNIGGADVAYARLCETGDLNDPDTCDATSVDWCIPLPDGDPDLCSPDPGPQPSDMCPDNSPAGDGDRCQPAEGEPDACAPWVTTFPTPDTCDPTYNDPDVCHSTPQWGDHDVCDPSAGEPDACGSEDPVDTCNPGGVPPDPDECEDGQKGDSCAPADNPDICPDGAGGDDDQCVPAEDPDICPEPFGGVGDTCDPTAGDPDVCSPTHTPDVCDPPGYPADVPNPVTVSSVEAESASSILPALGGVAAALGAAALWLRHRLRPKKPEEPETE